MSHAEIEKLARRELPPGEVLRVARHISECEECARAAREFAAEFSIDEVFALDADHPLVETDRRSYLPYFAAAAALLIVVTAALLVRAPRSTNHPPPPPRVVTPLPPPVLYERTEWNDAVRDAMASGNVGRPQLLAELRPPHEPVRGSEQPLAIMEPAGVVIETARPQFTWTPFQHAHYVVIIFDGNREVATSGAITSPSWTPPAPLPRNRRLTWQVEVTRGDNSEIIPAPPAPPAMFRIVSEETARDLDQARRLHPDDHLLLGVLYALAGLQARAEEELGRAGRPAETVLDSVRRW